MGSETLPTRTDGQTIDQNWFNILKSVLRQNFVPRNASGVATSLAGTLGESALKWARAYIESGYWHVGDIKAHHNYLGLLGSTAGQGWMKCDGRIVNETNYNIEHGPGAWAQHIGTSPLDGKYLPNMERKFLMGEINLITNDGDTPFTYTGNANNQVNLQHSHGLGSLHIRMVDAGGQFQIASDFIGVADWNAAFKVAYTAGLPNLGAATRIRGGMDNAQSATQSITPHSLFVLYYMRII